ncbi:hypothetical protein [Billgrantia montanilacus]|uniref:Peptidase M41 domain-containing protein n=1 Tax=Billgrantia montanilacus TaxID=2282305 RepID=A0A368TTC9_9GAMM|nr:hypothetical protein [Halomonas montanilacus]RCV87497.1 hypothetical protein DU505_17140 [Halomonas montanilacus]
MIALDKLWDMDLKTIAYHEAGHVVSIRSLGGHAHIRIEEKEGADPLSEKCFTGRAHALDLPTGLDDLRVVAVAGIAAQMLADDLETAPEEVMEAIELGEIELSDTDAEYGVTPEAMERAFEILQSQWEEVEREAQWEIACFENPHRLEAK